MILTSAERERVAQHAVQLEALCRCTPADDPQVERDVLVAVTNMMLVFPSTAVNELSVEARGAAYMEALDDVPAWAVRAAIRQWHRGNCGPNFDGKPYDYHWCPAPAELRRVAHAQMRVVLERRHMLARLLRAEPRLEFSDEHCTAMRQRLADLFKTLRTPPVGRHGSGGVVGVKLTEGADCGTQPRHSPA
jgi:hypothetical protein